MSYSQDHWLTIPSFSVSVPPPNPPASSGNLPHLPSYPSPTDSPALTYPVVPSQHFHDPQSLAPTPPHPIGRRPRSATNRLPQPTPPALQPNRKRFYSVSSLQPIPSASFGPMAFEWQTQAQQPVAFAPQFSLPDPSDEKHSLGFGHDQNTGYLGLQPQGYNMLGGSFEPMPYRPNLELDINAPQFQQLQNYPPPSAQSSAPYSGIPSDLASLPDGERITTPGVPQMFTDSIGTNYTDQFGQSSGNMFQQFDQSPFFPFTRQQMGQDTTCSWPNYYDPDYLRNARPPPQQQQQQHQQQQQQQQHQQQQSQFSNPALGVGTISPLQLPQNPFQLRQKSFADIYNGSSSSASSTDGNTALDEWTPINRAITNAEYQSSPNPNRGSPLSFPSATVPEPSRSTPMANEAMWTLPALLSTDSTQMSAVIRKYIASPNRLATGERKIVVMSPKVGQKSYGNEKRFLCPHPQAALIGQAWWHRSPDGCPFQNRIPPRVNISLSGEQPVKDASVSWSTVDGRNLDDSVNTQALKSEDVPFIGAVAGKNLHISDNDGKRREVNALVTIKVPLDVHAGPNGWGPEKGTRPLVTEEIIGTFESKEIKVISKPSKKKSNSKTPDAAQIPHGTTIALFNRVKSQTTSTRYLSVVQDPTRIFGSDGKSVTGAVRPHVINSSAAFAGFTANANTWESWIIWLVDPSKPGGPGRNPPLHPDWPSAPANALAQNLSIPIHYNQTVVLQSMQTGLCSPILVLRRVEQDSDVVGADGQVPQEKGMLHPCVPEGELPGDMVSQLQKVAFEVYETAKDSTRMAGSWLSCDQELVKERSVHAERRWERLHTPIRGGAKSNSVPSTPQRGFGVLPMTPHTNSVNLPSAPSSPNSATSSLDYFGAHSRKASSTSLVSPAGGISDMALPSTDGGPVRRNRTGSGSRGPLARPQHRKRQSGDVSASSSFESIHNAGGGHHHGERSFWTLNVGDACVWSIVSTEQVTYTFYVPEGVQITEPIAPFPNATKIVGPNGAQDTGPTSAGQHTFTSRTNLPLITVYGKDFVKTEDFHAHHVLYYGDRPAQFNEVRCQQVMAASEPEPALENPAPVLLVREDGQLILPTRLVYPPPRNIVPFQHPNYHQ